MSEIIFEEVSLENRPNTSRPSLCQLKAIIAFMEKHPEIAKKKHTSLGPGSSKVKKLWVELSNTVNSLDGAVKTTKGWIKFWSDKKRFMLTKQQQIEEGKVKSTLTALEQKILDLCDKKSYTPRRRKKALKQEPCNGDDLIDDDLFVRGDDYDEVSNHRVPTDAEDRHLTMIEKMVDVMDQQAAAMTQIAQASQTNSKALERIAEASHVQALAVDRLVGTFETISTSAHDIRNAILGIDYTLKRVYPATTQRQTTLFS